MTKSGPKPRWTVKQSVIIGESVNKLWSQEAKDAGLRKAALGRIAINEFFTDPDTIVTFIPFEEGEPQHHHTLQISPQQFETIEARALLLQSTTTRVASMALASRYMNPDNFHILSDITF